MRNAFFFLQLSCAVLSFESGTAVLSAQSFQASVRGRVVDPNGGAVATAKVTLMDEATLLPRATLSNVDGEFVFSALNPATYSLIAESPSFKRFERKGVVVSTQASLTIDVAMTLGDVTESVNVTGEVPLIETSNASTGQVVDRQKLVDLPNLGRNPFMLSKLAQNVIPVGNPKFNRMQDQSGSSMISIAGGPVRGNNYLLDGIPITDSVNRAIIIPTIEAVGEVKVQANTYDAQMGRTGGGVFNTFLKSGSNNMHGSLFGATRQTDWLANNFFANRAGTPIANQPFYNYGGAAGGPVWLPKVYNGKNKTFFWIAVEAYRQTEAASTRLAIPTLLERQGDFSQSRASAGGSLRTIYDPLTTRTDNAGNIVRDPFPGNVIPADRINRVGSRLASYYPTPNVPNDVYGGLNFDATALQKNRADQGTAKLDHEFKDWWRASASYLHYKSREPGNVWFGNIATPNQGVGYRKVDATQVNTTLTPSPSIVVTVRYGFNRFPNWGLPNSNGFDITTLGFPYSLAQQLQGHAFPTINTSDIASFGSASSYQNVYHSKNLSGSVAKFIGRHSWKVGADFRIIHHDGIAATDAGTYSFDDTFTRATPARSTAGTGASLASMLLGYPASAGATIATNVHNYVKYYAGFVHDDFRITNALTLNLGLRYEWETGIQDSNNAFIVGFDSNATNPIQSNVSGLTTKGVVQYAGLGSNGTTSGNPNLNKFSPRIGMALSITPKMTIRGGYGMFWSPIPFSLYAPLGYTQVTPYIASNDNNRTPAGSLSNPFPGGLLQPVGNRDGESAGIGQAISVYDRNARSTLVQQYSFDLQRQVAAGFAVDLGYVGSHSTHLVQGTGDVNINQLDPKYLALGSALNQSVPNPFYNNGGVFAIAAATLPRSQLLLPFPEFTTVSLTNSDRSRANYHSFFAKVQKRFGDGLSLLSTYTWSQNKDQSFGGVGNNYNVQPGTAQNNYDLGAEYGLSTVNTPHRWVSAISYELPFGKGRPFLNSSRLVDLAVGGWSVNAVSTYQSGFPLAISQINLNTVIGAKVQRPSATGLSPVTSGSLEDRIDGYINPAAFQQTSQFGFGNLSRTIGMRGPGQVNWDVSVFKTFQIGETVRAQFRAESLNVTNTPLFYGPNTIFGNPQFGKITTQANFPRLIQLGVRFYL